MRRAALALVVAAAALAAPASAADGTAHVSILFGSVTPTTIDVLAGDTVDWSNDSVRNHTVTADDGSYDSGTLSANEHYRRVFETPGAFLYHCRLHPYIHGEVDVRSLLLDRPVAPASGSEPYPLSGRAALPAGTAVAIEFDDGSGGGWQHVADTAVGSDGGFAVQVQPTTGGSYRAVAGDQVSPSVDLLVLNRTVSVVARGNRVSVQVAPASAGSTVVLQLYLKERFGWWPVAVHKLDKSSRTTFRLGHHGRVSARVLLTLPDAATRLASSKVLKLRAR